QRWRGRTFPKCKRFDVLGSAFFVPNRARRATNHERRTERRTPNEERRTIMPKVTFIIDDEPTVVEFEHGKLPYSHHGKPESFLDVAKNLGVPLEHACGGSCACTTCHVIIREG